MMVDKGVTEKADQAKILLAIEDLKSTIVGELTKLKNTEPFWWKVTQVGLPVLLAAGLGFFVWMVQSPVTAELALRQFLFERRLDAYKQIYDKASAAYSAYSAYSSMPADNSQAADLGQEQLYQETAMLSELSNGSRILCSAALYQLLQDTWLQIAQGRNVGNTDALLTKVVAQMRRDLKIDVLDGAVTRK